MSSIVDCSNLTKGAVLARIYNNAVPLRRRFHGARAEPMSTSEASNFLKDSEYVNYCHGRSLKINFRTWPNIDSRSYDRDQGGPGTFQKLINQLKDDGIVSPPSSKTSNFSKTKEAWLEAWSEANFEKYQHHWKKIEAKQLAREEFKEWVRASWREHKEWGIGVAICVLGGVIGWSIEI